MFRENSKIVEVFAKNSKFGVESFTFGSWTKKQGRILEDKAKDPAESRGTRSATPPESLGDWNLRLQFNEISRERPPQSSGGGHLLRSNSHHVSRPGPEGDPSAWRLLKGGPRPRGSWRRADARGHGAHRTAQAGRAGRLAGAEATATGSRRTPEPLHSKPTRATCLNAPGSPTPQAGAIRPQ